MLLLQTLYKQDIEFLTTTDTTNANSHPLFADKQKFYSMSIAPKDAIPDHFCGAFLHALEDEAASVRITALGTLFTRFERVRS